MVIIQQQSFNKNFFSQIDKTIIEIINKVYLKSRYIKMRQICFLNIIGKSIKSIQSNVVFSIRHIKHKVTWQINFYKPKLVITW